MTVEVKVPQLPESVTDATLVSWHKAPGQAVERDARGGFGRFALRVIGGGTRGTCCKKRDQCQHRHQGHQCGGEAEREMGHLAIRSAPVAPNRVRVRRHTEPPTAAAASTPNAAHIAIAGAARSW